MGNYNWGRGCDGCETDHGPKPFVTNIMRVARQNQNFRTAFWTGCHLQMTLMCIPPCGEIGVEMHPDTDQFIRVEEGQALVRMGDCRENLDFQCRIGRKHFYHQCVRCVIGAFDLDCCRDTITALNGSHSIITSPFLIVSPFLKNNLEP